jgi:hypothetical protein
MQDHPNTTNFDIKCTERSDCKPTSFNYHIGIFINIDLLLIYSKIAEILKLAVFTKNEGST